MTVLSELLIPGFRGELISPDHPGYDDARAVWNGMIDRRPQLIAGCSGTADVAAAVRFARDRGLEIAVRGGHDGAPEQATEGSAGDCTRCARQEVAHERIVAVILQVLA